MAQLVSADRESRRIGPRRISSWFAASLIAALLANPGQSGEKEPAASDLLTHEVVRVSAPEATGPVEASVAINPTRPDHLIAVSLQRGRPVTSNFAYVSKDGGRSWTTVAAPNPGQRTQGDDAVAFTADGTAVHTYIAVTGIRQARPTRASSGIFTRASRDGLTWTNPVPVVDQINTAAPCWDKPYVRVDTSAESPHKGHVYVAFTRFDEYGSKDPEHRTHIYFSRSRDGGQSFSVPHRISEAPGDCLDSSNTLMGVVPAVGPKGEVYVVWAGPQGLVFDKSTDGGWTFGKDRVISDTPGGWDFAIQGVGRCNGLPVTAVDLSPGKDRGSIYVNWIDRRNGDPDVFVMASRNGGETWSPPVRVNQDPKGNGKDQFFTWLAVDPEDGSVNVFFYDRRDTDGTLTRLTLARSVDGGRTFVNYPVKQDAFACERAGFFGDYCGLDARGGRVVAVYPYYTDKKQIVLSAALFHFKPRPLELRLEGKATPAPDSPPKGTDVPQKKPGEEQPPKEKESAVPDLRELMARPQSELRGVTQWFEADRGNLTRFYTIPSSPTRHARLKRFYSGWLTALEKLNPDRLSQEGRADYARLKETLERELRQLELQAKAQAEIAPLIPFAAAIINLEEARRRMEKVDAPKTAAFLTALKKQIDQSRQAVEAGWRSEGKASGIQLDKDTADRAAETISGLRTALRNWFSFHNSYDPLFTWWMGEPYKEVEQALQGYATFLGEKIGNSTATVEKKAPDPEPASRPAHAPVAEGSEVPNLQELAALPRSELRGVIEQYQTARGGRGRAAGAGVPVPVPPQTPERRAQSKKHATDWLAALQKLDFDALSQEGRLDYLLLKNHLEHELRRLDLPPVSPGEGGARGRDASGISGRPIGRAALLVELAGEMIPYTPEDLIVIARQEHAWCEAEMKKASREMGLGDDWLKAVEKVKTLHVEPGKQPEAIRDLAREAIDYVQKHELVTVPPVARETWRMEMMSPQRQLVNPFFTGGEVISVSFPTNTMSHEAKLQSMRGNNIPFSRATVHHELIPGHHLQGYTAARYRTYRRLFSTPFWTEGWALYWEMLLYDRGFPRTPEDRVGFLFWRMHRCARIIFSLSFHLGKMSPPECIDFLVERVGHERDNATAEVRRSFAGSYGPLYQAAYMLGGLQIRALRRELVETGKMTDRAFHDAILRENRIPIEMVRASLAQQKLTRDFTTSWRFYGPISPGDEPGQARP